MKNRILAGIMVILAALAIFTVGVNFHQQKKFLQERTVLMSANSALTTELTANQKLLETSEQKMATLQTANKNLSSARENEAKLRTQYSGLSKDLFYSKNQFLYRLYQKHNISG